MLRRGHCRKLTPLRARSQTIKFGLDARAARITWTAAVVVLALYAAYVIRATLFVFVLALFVAYMIAPLVNVLDRYKWRRMPRTASVAIAFVLVIGVVAAAVALVAPVVSDEAAKLAEQLPKIAESGNLAQSIPLPSWLDSYRGRLNDFVQESLSGATAAAAPVMKEVGTKALHFAGGLIYIVLIPILAFIFIKDGPEIRRTLVREPDSGEKRSELSQLLWELHDALSHYVRAVGLLCLATLVAYGLFFTLAGVPYGLLLAAVAAVLELLPLVGPLGAAVIALFVAGASGYEHLLWIVLFIAAYRVFQDYVLSPMLMSGNIGVHPALVIFGLLAGEQLAGVPGIFLSIPVMAALIILYRHARKKDPVVSTPADAK
ncbi:MAG: AI-2E family transporter [Betaproteobacteria bacterium]|nr:AI-2E family transporter [Betaproteobacteria bacterium]MBV9359875.1 AI-2E family transporter [Betaproteobacteria bacterium]